jgi:histidine triad (HIT) family protein
VSVDPAAGCLFCRIARKEEPGALVLETEAVVAFLDHRPLFPGHCLVVPREHVETIGDLPAPLTAPLWDAVRVLARAVEGALGADGSFVAVNNRVSQSVPHLHVHVVPRWNGDTNFMPVLGDVRVLPEALDVTYDRLSAALDS